MKQLHYISGSLEELPLSPADPQEVEIEVDDGNRVDIPEAVCLSALSDSCSGVNTILVAS